MWRGGVAFRCGCFGRSESVDTIVDLTCSGFPVSDLLAPSVFTVGTIDSLPCCVAVVYGVGSAASETAVLIETAMLCFLICVVACVKVWI